MGGGLNTDVKEVAPLAVVLSRTVSPHGDCHPFEHLMGIPINYVSPKDSVILYSALRDTLKWS